MSHTDVLIAINRRGGRLVASFTLDPDGRTEGAPSTHNRKATCSVCGEKGHTSRHPRHTGMTEAKQLLARMAAERRTTRVRR